MSHPRRQRGARAGALATLAAALLSPLLAACPTAGDDGSACSSDDDCAEGLACYDGACKRLGAAEGPLAFHVIPALSTGFRPQAISYPEPQRKRLQLSLCPPSRLKASVSSARAGPIQLFALGESGIPGVHSRFETTFTPGQLDLELPAGAYRFSFVSRPGLQEAPLPATSAELYLAPCESGSLEVETQLEAATRTLYFRLVADHDTDPAPRCDVRVQAFDATTGEALSAPLEALQDPATGRCSAELDGTIALPVRVPVAGEPLRLRLVIGPADSRAPSAPTQELAFRYDPQSGSTSLAARDLHLPWGLCADHDEPFLPGECLCDRVCIATDGTRRRCDDPDPGETLEDGRCEIGLVGPIAGTTTPVLVTVFDRTGRRQPRELIESVVAEGVLAAPHQEDCTASPDPPQTPEQRCGYGFQAVGGAYFRSAPGAPVQGRPGVFRLQVLPGTYRFRVTPTVDSPLQTSVAARPNNVPVQPGATIPERWRICVPPGGAGCSSNDFSMVLEEKPQLGGTVTLSASRTPAFDARVTAVRRGLEERGGSAFTTNRGEFRIPVEPGEYRLLIQPRDDAAPWSYAGPVRGGEQVEIRLDPPARVVGTVTGTDAAGQRPLHPAIVRAYRCLNGCFATSVEELAAGEALLVGEAATDADGNFSMVLPARGSSSP